MRKIIALLMLVSGTNLVVAHSDKPHALEQVCHRGRIIWVDPSAVPAHVAHGDPVGDQCEAVVGDY